VKILIAEEALRSLDGHWFEYVRTIVEGCRRAGDEVTVACHRDAVPEVVQAINAEPTFPNSAWDPSYQKAGGGRFRRLLRIFTHNLQFYRAARRVITQKGPFDRVFAPTILIDHLVAWMLIAWTLGRSFDRLILLFVNGHGIYQGPGRPPTFPRTPNTWLSRLALRCLRRLVVSGKVVLAAETEAMAAEFTRFCGLEFEYFPHPVSIKLDPTRKVENTAHEVVFASLGLARYEKGSDLLLAAIVKVREKRPDLKHIRFVIQWGNDFKDSGGKLISPNTAPAFDSGITFLTSSCMPQEYRLQLQRACCMILPYRAQSYYARVSRVATEAAMLGIPLIYTEDTWLEEFVRKCGAGVSFRNEDADDLAKKIGEMADQLATFRSKGINKAELARQLYSVERFHRHMAGAEPNE
jgi:glycosyltransferase involved in cell wall biosynthesis